MSLKTDRFGNRFWLDDKNRYHREDGPAIEWPSGFKEYWVYGVSCSGYKDYLERIHEISKEEKFEEYLKREIDEIKNT